jgi:hypothetical protein
LPVVAPEDVAIKTELPPFVPDTLLAPPAPEEPTVTQH